MVCFLSIRIVKEDAKNKAQLSSTHKETQQEE